MANVSNDLKILKLQKRIPLFCLNKNGVVIGVNNAFTKLTGFKTKDVQLNRIISFLNKGSVRRFNRLFNECKIKKIVSGDFDLVQKNSNSQTARVTLISKEKSGVYIGIIHFFDNVGQLKAEIDAVNSIADHNLKKLLKANDKLESARKAEREALSIKEKFLTNISHELRTPLAGISGITQLLADTELNSLQKEYVDNIIHSADHLVKMINELLDLSKLKSEKFQLELQEFSLYEHLKNLASSFSVICEKKNLTFNFSYNKNIPEILVGDSLRISQVINNLLSNAFKFTDKGYVYLKVELEKKVKQKAYIKFEINDTGIGIDKEKLKTVFDEFQQGGSEIARLYGGTGLGLSISQYLVKLQGGEIFVESKEGKGSSFFFTLPFQIGVLRKKTENVSAERLTGIKVLIADDNRVNILVLESILKKEGAVVVSSSNGEEAFEKFNSHTFDLLLIDLSMPGMDGYQLTSAVRKKTKNNIPIIAVTAGSSVAVEKACKDVGFTGIIYKPFTNDDLVNEIIKFLPELDRGGELKIRKSSKNKTIIKGIELGMLESIAQGKKDVLNDLLKTICGNINSDLPELKNSLVKQNRKKSKDIIHKIKTSYGYLEMKKEVALFNECEVMIESGASFGLVTKRLSPIFNGFKKLINNLEKQIQE